MLRVFYGGTFDPVHNGHLAVAMHARDLLDADVLLMPAADPPHKGPTHAGMQARGDMAVLATEDIPHLGVDLREFARIGPSYSVDTFAELREELGRDAPLAMLVGEDSFLALPTWHRWRELFALCHFVVAERPGNDADARLPAALADAVSSRMIEGPQALHARAAGCVLRMRQPLRPESATALRQRIAQGQPWQDWVPQKVAEYIERKGLYGVTPLLPTAGAASL